MKTKTTAQLRNAALVAEEASQYERAAELYSEVLEAYPSGGGALQAADRRELLANIQRCAGMPPKREAFKVDPDTLMFAAGMAAACTLGEVVR